MTEVEIEELGSQMRVGAIAAKNLEEPPFDRMAGERADPKLGLPLGRIWSKRLTQSVRPIVAEGAPPGSKPAGCLSRS